MYTVLVSELTHGHAEFETEEEAQAFIDGVERDWDLVKWTDGEISHLSFEVFES